MTSSPHVPLRKFHGSAGFHLIFGLVGTWEGQHRPLVDGERRIGNYVLPPFQRPPVWTEMQKQKLIESIYLGLPIGTLIVNMTEHGKPTDQWLLDGQQRLSAILGYVAGKFPVDGWRYPDLPPALQRHFTRLPIAVTETAIVDPEECRDLYDRLVYGGTPHGPVDQRIDRPVPNREAAGSIPAGATTPRERTKP